MMMEKAHTLEQLTDGLQKLCDSYELIGGDRALNDYGRGQYTLAYRILEKLKKIQDNQKASEDA